MGLPWQSSGLRPHASTSGALGSTPGQGMKSLHSVAKEEKTMQTVRLEYIS